jgi:hypothetical protein
MTDKAEMPVDLWISEYVANLWVTECQGTTRYIRADLHAAEIASQAAEIERLREQLATYDKWFADNASNLANHGIGGFKFDLAVPHHGRGITLRTITSAAHDLGMDVAVEFRPIDPPPETHHD